MRLICRTGYALLFAAVCFLGLQTQASANVTGPCANCHTMHNSQAGTLVSSINRARLLTSDCVGCHSSSSADTIVQLGTTRIPIVYNTAAPPVNELAGGNFHWVAKNGHQYGHNVRGISPPDSFLAIGPGGENLQCGNSCHQSFSLPDTGFGRNGCEGCHGSVKHHGASVVAGQPVTAAEGWYRFLMAPSSHSGFGLTQGVAGIEDPNWEQTPTSTQHNIYFGGDGTAAQSPRSLNKFCASCHAKFHAPGFFESGGLTVDNGGGVNPWLRHPTNYAIPNKGEFAPLFATPYNPAVPVAKPVLTSYQAAKIEIGDQVSCVSCHRAHGSPYPDMLRWDYSAMKAHDGGSASGTGCFFCHTAKDS